MASDLLSVINTFAVDYVPRTVIDNVFKHDPLFAWLKKNVPATYPGGDFIREIFRYDAMNGGAFSVGEDFNITQPQTDTAMKFSPSFSTRALMNAGLRLGSRFSFTRALATPPSLPPLLSTCSFFSAG